MAKKNRPTESVNEVAVWPQDWKPLTAVFVANKVFFFLIVFVALKTLPPMFSLESYKMNKHHPKGSPPHELIQLATWDAQHFLFLADVGYQKDTDSTAMYPLWPMILRGLSQVFGNPPIIAGLVVANLFSLLAFLFLFQLFRNQIGESAARNAMLLFLAFPGALFFQVLYSESPFLLFDVLFMAFLVQKKYSRAAIFAFFLPLTRGIGIFSFLPFAWMVFQDCRSDSQNPAKLKNFGWTLSPLIGWGFYFIFMKIATGNFFEGFAVGKFYAAQGSFWNTINIPHVIEVFLNWTSVHNYLGSFLDRFWFIPMIAICVYLFRKFDKVFFFHTFPTLWLNATMSNFTSFTRYLAVLYPLAMGSGHFFENPKRSNWLWPTLALLYGVQVILTIRYINFYWAG